MHINDMKRADFDALPVRGWNENIGEFHSLVILPLRQKHDSGYRIMDFVAVRKGEAVCRLGGCADVMHLGGIGGMKGNGRGWSVDCLPKSGLLHVFCDAPINCGQALSSFELFSEVKR